jgi:hypothetical protein
MRSGCSNSSDEFILVDSNVSNKVVTTNGCCEVYAAKWEFIYEVTVTPDQLSQFIQDLPKATIATRDDPTGKKIDGG